MRATSPCRGDTCLDIDRLPKGGIFGWDTCRSGFADSVVGFVYSGKRVSGSQSGLTVDDG